MRIIAAIVVSLIVSLAVYFTVKFWGLSQPYAAYNHPLFQATDIVIFKKPAFENIDKVLTTTSDNIYLDIANTADQKVVIVRTNPDRTIDHSKNVRLKKFQDVKQDVLHLQNYKEQLKNRKIIFNLAENAIAGHLIFSDELKALDLDKGENIIVTTPYETMAKAIKELHPTLIFGTTQPEILKFKAMESLYLIEAAQIRADIVIFPLEYYKQPFFTEKLQNEIKRRYKKIIVGPIKDSEIEVAKQLNPFGIIVEE